MSIDTKKEKAKKLGITFAEDITEAKLDQLIDEKTAEIARIKEEKKIEDENKKKAADFAAKNKLILKDVDGDDVDQSEYFFPNLETGEKNTAPAYFNKVCGMPVDREELIDVFNLYFPKSKGFLFYRLRNSEVYLVIVPLKYATTISKENESRPGDYQRHAMSFINEGSVNTESLKLKLARIAKHSSISREPLA